ncbi:LexA family transcriptional regulator [Rhodobacter sp. NTK016B]|uniref:S24 family peptidase n=1 Tax=Rhodobacter sp. NTK016B TaxID=2759676 RepID=UPI001A8C4A58|nr:LexA family transcriptional regulator [Rhodobacter sp. NTK016B]MBN8290556.1 LexA family transcriptional regulator [Rhodobacter sp. NTK016B]
MDPILDEIDRALKKKGLSPAAASKLAAGHYSLIKNMKASKAGGKRYSVETLEKLGEVLDLELYYGPKRENAAAPSTTISGEQFSTVARYEAEGAAGNGAINFDGPPIDHLAFSKRWLEQNGISAGDSVLINVRGDSMEPSIYDGDLVMIDRRKTHIRSGRIYAVREGDSLRIKRLELIPDAAIILRSDNPKYPPEHRTGEAMNDISLGVIGEVVWSGHKWG